MRNIKEDESRIVIEESEYAELDRTQCVEGLMNV
jgi:hypothetical protein